MKVRNTKMELLGSVPIPKALLALGLPTIIGMLINAPYNLVNFFYFSIFIKLAISAGIHNVVTTE